MWADIKSFVASRFCRNLEEVKDAIFEYKKTLTPEKCVRYISHLKSDTGCNSKEWRMVKYVKPYQIIILIKFNHKKALFFNF